MLELRVLPSIVSRGSDDADFDWGPLLEATGLDLDSLNPVEPAANPPLNCGLQYAWEGTYPDQPLVPIRLESCTVEARPAYLEVMPPWSERAIALASGESGLERRRRAERVLGPAITTLFLIVLAGGTLLARRNLRLGRADRQGAFRIAVVVFVFRIVVNLVEANHAGTAFQEFGLLLELLAAATWSVVLVWIFYCAVEPFVRRIWPQTMIAWRRLLDGRLRDPLIGRDMLIGAAVAQTTTLARLAFPFVTDPPEPISGGPLEFLSGLKLWAVWTASLGEIVLPALIMTTFVVLLRIFLRRDWLTWLAPTALMVTLLTVATGELKFAFFFALIWGPIFFLIIRFGLLAMVMAGLISTVDQMVRVWDPSTWFFPYVVAGLIVLLLPVFYGFFISLGSRKLFSADLLDS